jgi:hypothetical protein
VNKQGHAAEFQHLLGAVGVHARAYACGRDYGCVDLATSHCETEVVCRGVGA